MWKNRLAIVAVLATAALAPLTTTAMAEHNFVPDDHDYGGTYSVAALEHGFLTALDVNTGAIVATARTLLAGDTEAMAYVAHIEAQAGWPTLFGLMPDWQNNDSPVHLAMHDKLATGQQLLDRLVATLPEATAVQQLAAKVKADRLTYTSDVSVCRASATPFTTAQTTGVEWGRFLTHGPSLSVALGGLGMLAAGALLALETTLRRRKALAEHDDAHRDGWAPSYG